MKKTFKKSLCVLMSLFIVLTTVLISPLTAQAVDTALNLEKTAVSFWADPENDLTQEDVDAFTAGTKTTMTGAVGVFRRSSSSSNYYLFLPSNADCTNLKVWFTAGSATVDGTALTNGEATNVFADVNEGGITKQYTLTLDSTNYALTVLKSGDVGTVYIDTESGSISNITTENHTTSESGTIMVISPDGTVDYDGPMEKMSGRGNGTWSTSNTKNPYNVKLGVSTSLLGMNKAKKWCLLANTKDDTLIKNQLTYDFAKYIGINFQPVCKPVDLYVNQQYYGSYQLSEKVEIKSNRLNVTDAYENLEIANGTYDSTTGITTPADLSGTSVVTYSGSTNSVISGSTAISSTAINTASYTGGSKRYSTSLSDPDDYTGGYLYELEISNRWITENAGFCGYNRQGWVIKSCDYATEKMVTYSYNLLYALGSAVYNGGTVPSKSTTTSTTSNLYVRTTSNDAPSSEYQGKSWSDILDADSAVKYYWTQEFFKNMDSSTSSTYFYKDSDSIDSMLYAGPMWDMDNSIGYDRSGASDSTRWGCDWTEATNWYTKNARIYRYYYNDSKTTYSSDKYSPLNFYAALATNCSDFWQMAQNYWYNLIEPATQILLSDEQESNDVLHSTSYYANLVQKSGTMNNLRHNLNSDGAYNASDVTTGINAWFTTRSNWISDEFGKVDINDCTVSAIPSQTCTGSEITPDVTVTYNGITLEAGKDYTVTYSNNVAASKTAVARITGLGRYTNSRDVNFTISSGTLSGGNAEIPEYAYSGDTISVTVTNSSGAEVNQFVKYQWKADNVAIDGATQSTYTITTAEQGKNITVEVSGDETNFAGLSITSNACSVFEGEKPVGYTKTIASWNYDYTVDSTALATADETGETYYYTATDGENATVSQLTASVNAKDNAKIKWSGTADLYENSSTSLGTDQSPVMGTSKQNGLAWGEYPYFETKTSTLGYENIYFSAKLGGTKKGPRDWKLQYSLDGQTYYDVDGATYSITNNKTMEQAFDNVLLPTACENQSNLYLRVVVTADISIGGANAIISSTSGDASINNVAITGSSTAIVTSLEAPEISSTATTEDTSAIFDTDSIVIADTNGGADVYYSVDGSEAQLYTESFNPFDSSTAKLGDKVTVTAWAQFDKIQSEVTTATFTFAGVNINTFAYDSYSTNVSNGAVFSTDGAYGESGKMTAYTDESGQYVPLWISKNSAYSISPDDGMVWTENSGFTFETSTAGYKNVTFTAKAYTTAQGPNSVQLQYSINGTDWVAVSDNVQLNANGSLDQAFMTVSLPSECDNQAKLYVRLATVENKTHGSDTTASAKLHNNASKGNFYINNVVIGGEDNGTYKMPYTNKTSSYFGGSGVIEYTNADSVAMQYAVTNPDGEVISSGAYPSTGISIGTMEKFDSTVAGPYTVSIWAGDEDDKSIVNTRQYYYKGTTITKFKYNDTTKSITNYLNSDSTVATNTGGANAGTLSMYPNGETATTLSYTGTYGVKVSWAEDNTFVASKKLDKPKDNGYWLITTSTKGYSNVTLNLDQLSSNKGPRDWGLAYSLDGTNYTYIAQSNVRAISNDAVDSAVETYNNFALPSECDNQEQIYIKVFINGGESVDGSELETLLKGNTGIDNIELNGVALPTTATVTFNPVVLENVTDTTGTVGVDATVTINGVDYETNQSTVAVELVEGKRYTASVSVNGTFAHQITFTAKDGDSYDVTVVAIDKNGDGIVNAKDFAMIYNLVKDSELKKYYINVFHNFINVEQEYFSYAN